MSSSYTQNYYQSDLTDKNEFCAHIVRNKNAHTITCTPSTPYNTHRFPSKQ